MPRTNADPIVVVGGGMSGASVAYHLSERVDREIVVFERQSLASETTTKAASHIGYWGGETGAIARMKQYGIELFNEILGERETGIETHVMGRLGLATTEAGADRLASEALCANDEASSNAAIVEYLSGDELPGAILSPELDFENVEGGIYRPNIVYSHPYKIALELVDRARDNGVTVQVNTEVTDISVSEGQVSGVETEDTFVKTDAVVCAAGPWNVELLRNVDIELPVEHSLGSVLLLRLDEPLKSTLPSVKHVETDLYLRQHGNDRIFVGHRPDHTEEVDPDRTSDKVSRELVLTAAEVLPELVPVLEDADLEEEWVGVRTMVADRDPIGGGTGIEGLYLTVYNGDGIMLAPAAGRIIARLIDRGETPEYYEDVSLSRFDGHRDVFR